MASAQQVQALQTQAAALDQVNIEKLTRSNLGEESLAAELAPRLEKINRLKMLATQYAQGVHDSFVSQMGQVFSQLAQAMAQQAGRSNTDFIGQRQQFLNSIDSQLEVAKQWETHFIASAIEARGFLQDEGIRQEYQKTVADLKEQAEATIKEVRAEATRAIEEAKQLAKDIEERARRTATRVSVQEAQNQFKEAQANLESKVKLWGRLSAVAILAFFAVAFFFYFATLPNEWERQILYHAVVRIAILSGVGALAGFTLKMLRAYMHMRERNLHRQRVANSIEAFVVSTLTNEVHDVILAQLVDAVVAFGISGLLSRESDSLGTHQIPADAVTRLISSLSRKEVV